MRTTKKWFTMSTELLCSDLNQTKLSWQDIQLIVKFETPITFSESIFVLLYLSTHVPLHLFIPKFHYNFIYPSLKLLHG